MTWYLPYGIQIVFRYPERLWAAGLIVFLLLLACLEIKRRRIVLRDPWLALHLPLSSLSSFGKKIIWWLAASAALCCMVAAFAIPERKIITKEKVYGQMRLTFIFDVSLSMVRAEDVKPNRMRAAKDMIIGFLDMLAHDQELQGRYQLALIPFAGTAQPLFLTFTASREEFLANLEEINERTISLQGTSVLAALLGYESLLSRYPPREETTDIAILISDGGQEEGREGEKKFFPAVINDIREVVRMYTAKNIKIHSWQFMVSTIGIGKVEIDKIGKRIAKPVELIIRDSGGNFDSFYREDSKNPQSPVLTSRLDEETLMEIARLGGGSYYHFSDIQTLAHAFRELILAHRMLVDEIPRYQFEPMIQWFLVPALVLWYVLFGFGDWIKKIIYGVPRFVKKMFVI